MEYDKFLIAPLNAGLQTNLRPWLIPDDAFERLKNAYVFRGRVRKRFGSTSMDPDKTDNIEQLYSRLRTHIGTTDGSGNVSGNAPATIYEVGQMFSIGTEMFTVSELGTPGTMLTTGSATTHTYNTTTGAYVINGATPATALYFYPALPVMGITNYETELSANQEKLYAFDTRFSYVYTSGSGWNRFGSYVWSGDNSDFFWAVNHRGTAASDDYLYVSNGVVGDGIQYWTGAAWVLWQPAFGTPTATNKILTAKIIIPFKGRLLLLNTIESVSGVVTNFPDRVWWSVVGNNLDANAYRVDIPGNGGFLDGPIQEDIVGAQIIRDRLIVFYERSTWELVFTGNNVNPFIWQQINIELGVESTFSVVPFDKHILGIGQTGIHACNGANVERIDAKIPDEVFDFHKNTDTNSVLRVQGIRDYKNELVYWAVPNKDNDTVYPDRVLTYNYANGSWALFDDSITAFGYGEPVHEQIVAGNQEGYTFLVDTSQARNAPALQITNITEAAGVVTLTMIDHNLDTDDYIAIEYAMGITELNDNIYQVTRVTDDTVTIVDPPTVTGTYTGRGVATRVSKIDILTKQYNFYNSVGDGVYLAKTDFLVNRTDSGQILVDSFPSTSTESMTTDGIASGAILGTNILETTAYAGDALEATQTRFWHVVYFQTQGENVQLRLYLDDTMMTNTDIAWSYFELHAMFIYALKAQEL